MEREIGISQNTLKNLYDKSSDKRKLATKEIEKYVRNLVETKNEDQIKTLIDYFEKEYINSREQPQKKAGLISFAAIALGLTRDEALATRFVGALLPPVLNGMRDADAKIRLQACETMYNIAKSLRATILPKFNDVFGELIKVFADFDEEVKRLAQQLDRILKDVVSEGIVDSKYFDLKNFMPILCEKLQVRNPVIRHLLISWINVLNDIPNLNLIHLLPSFLEELMMMIGDVNKEIRIAADACLLEFLTEIKEHPNDRTAELDSEVVETLVFILLEKVNIRTKMNALVWLSEYLKLFDNELQKGNQNTNLKQAILPKLSIILKAILMSIADEEHEIRRAAGFANDILAGIINKCSSNQIDFRNLINLLKDLLHSEQNRTVLSTIVWMKNLLISFQAEVMPLLDETLQYIIEKLNDPEEKIVKIVGDLLGNFTYSQEKFHLVISRLMKSFQENQALNSKSHTILKRLWQSLAPTRVFITLAEQLLHNPDYKFVSQIVQKLDFILLTDEELYEVRKTLKDISTDKENLEQNVKLFESFFRTWSYNSVSTITLCLLSQQYELAYRIICYFAEIEIDVETLTQIAKLVQLLESPIFVYLRLQLLEVDRYPYLLKTLSGILMILPQGKAFNALRLRLKNIIYDKNSVDVNKDRKETVVDIEKLLDIFRQTQKRIRDQDMMNKSREILVKAPEIKEEMEKTKVGGLEISLEKSVE